MTQQQLANEVGASRQTKVAIEKGNYSPSLEQAFRIARVFKKSSMKYSQITHKRMNSD
jgi:putative transcriptional regulator